MPPHLALFILLVPVGSPPSTVVSDWTIPARFRSQTVVGRVKGFPEKIVALTFDDGPDRRNTPMVLDALKRHGQKATFFLIGEQVPANAELVRRMVADGHAVGNHSWSHPYRLSRDEGLRQIQRCDAAIMQAIGRKSACFRTPGGFTDNGIAQAARSQGLPNFLWMVSSADTRRIGSAAIARNVTRYLHPGDIVLMHDGPGHRETALAVPTILAGMERNGYRSVTVPELCRIWDRWLAEKGVNKGLKPTQPPKLSSPSKPRRASQR
ncbi:MAG: polysaccharide deacetylase family protein [Chthonomonadales bacterium]|nr:polysaccharide deacetylase family protein [Chthonomonadales bacterium]